MEDLVWFIVSFGFGVLIKGVFDAIVEYYKGRIRKAVLPGSRILEWWKCEAEVQKRESEYKAKIVALSKELENKNSCYFIDYSSEFKKHNTAMKESTIRQAITGIIHGDREITKESSEYAAGKGKEVMEFLKSNNLLYGNFIPEPPAPPKDRNPDNPMPPFGGNLFCTTCKKRIGYDLHVEIKNNRRHCIECDGYISGPRVIVEITPDTTYGSGTLT